VNYNLTIIRPRGFLHSSAFFEVRDSLSWALTALGHSVNVTENWIDSTDTNIIFGAELLAPNQPQALPPGSVLYNLEQPSHPNLEKVKQTVLGSKCKVWDYSKTNVEMWRQLGASVWHVPIGYTPNLTRIPKAETQDIDVLFLGWMTPRRVEVIQKLRDAGLNVVASDKCYGGGRDNLISRAKVCLNVHHDGRNLFEIVRVSYLLANSKTVVSETSYDMGFGAGNLGENVDIERGISTTPYESLVDACMQATAESGYYRTLGGRGFELFSQRDYVTTVQSALSDPTPQEKVAARYERGYREGDMKDFMEFLKEKAHGTCLEIGTRDGASTSALLSGVERNGGVVLSVDITECSGLFGGHPQWKFICSSSRDEKLRVPPLDLLLIDGDHSLQGYRSDLRRFAPLVKPGGLILSHDIHPEPGHEFYMNDLREEFFRFAKEENLEHYELKGYAGMGVMVKRAPVVDSDESWQASEALLQA
jgi:predicted O-methyltransferase YrrM